MSLVTLDFQQHRLQLAGELTRDSVVEISKKQVCQFCQQSALTLDLTAITKVDSAGLAWLLYFLEQSIKQQCQLTLTGVPKDLLNLAQLSGVIDFLPITNE
jgi:phospholipid transport system transporter-binding protein